MLNEIGGADGLIVRAAWIAVLLVLAVLDVRTRVLPNRLVYPALILALISPLLDSRWAWDGVVGALAVSGLFLALHLARPGSVGGGDVKMAGLVGAIVGPAGALTAILVTTLTGCGMALAAASVGRRGRLAYGPFLALGGAFSFW